MVTASHNPAPYNGFKLVLGENPVSEEDILAIKQLVEEGAQVSGEGTLTSMAVVDDYIEYTSKLAQTSQLKVVVDAGN